MPSLSDTTRRRWRLPVVFYAHPFELALGAALVLNGVRGFIEETSPTLVALPTVTHFLYLLVSSLGGLGVIMGASTNDPPGHHGRAVSIERASLFLVAASYAALGGLLVGYNGTAGIGTALVSTVIAVACLLRARAIRLSALIILEQIRAANTREDARP